MFVCVFDILESAPTECICIHPGNMHFVFSLISLNVKQEVIWDGTSLTLKSVLQESEMLSELNHNVLFLLLTQTHCSLKPR